ncbi:MAG: MBL fold metallo-hydrolase [Gemmatimonadota bacterium]|nr:MBL fold metallo-hydrolase [Gemmatimonadota bacterium]
MLLKRFYDTKLAQASFLIGCAATGEAIIVDANRDVAQYLHAADAEGLRISHVTETHIHADFVSGSRELAERSGGLLLLSGEGGPDWSYAFAESAKARLLHDGDTFMVGNLRVEVMHTPGHTPEHLTFVVTDTPATDQPIGAITGDFIFAGDVGRPDLLEIAAHVVGTMEASARTLFHSLQRFRQRPDHIQLWPGHGAGSACGKALGAMPSTTLGYEKIANWGLRLTGEDAFVEAVLAGQPEPPRYFAEMKRINKEGPRVLNGLPHPALVADAMLADVITRGELVVDTRSADAFAARHVPGTINIPLNKSFSTWAGWFVPFDRDFYLIAGDTGQSTIAEVARDLAMIGLDRVAGYFEPGAIDAWVKSGREVWAIAQMSPAEVARQLAAGDVAVLDVRGRSEWMAGHLPNVKNMPAGYIADDLASLPNDRPLVLHCQGGGRSAIAASVLRARGMSNVVNMRGGFAAWEAQGNAVHVEPFLASL